MMPSRSEKRQWISMAFLGAIILFTVCLASPAHSTTILITPEEADAPAAPATVLKEDLDRSRAAVTPHFTLGGPTPPPMFEIVSPANGPDRATKVPFDLVVRFKSITGADILPNLVAVFLVKEKDISLTERIKDHISASGIDARQLVVPPGLHLLKIVVKDSNGKIREIFVAVRVPGS